MRRSGGRANWAWDIMYERRKKVKTFPPILIELIYLPEHKWEVGVVSIWRKGTGFRVVPV